MSSFSFWFIWIHNFIGQHLSTAITNIFTLTVRESTLVVRIWRLQTSDSDDLSRSPHCKGKAQQIQIDCFTIGTKKTRSAWVSRPSSLSVRSGSLSTNQCPDARGYHLFTLVYQKLSIFVSMTEYSPVAVKVIRVTKRNKVCHLCC